MTLGETLKTVRTSRRLTIEQLVEIFSKYGYHVSKSMISRWENDRAVPLNTYLALYAKTFNLDMNELLGVDYRDDLHRRSNSIVNPYIASNEKLAILFDKTRDLTEEELDSVFAIVNQIRKLKGLE